MKEFWLVRHGHKEEGGFHYNPEKKVQDPPLSKQGIKQAKRLAKNLGRVHFDAVYASDLIRTRQTAALLNRKIKQSITPEPALREINFGVAEQLSWQELEEQYPDLFDKFFILEKDLPYPEGETGADVVKRLHPFIASLLQQDWQRCLLVTHGGIIRIWLCHILAMDQGKRFRLGDPPRECSVSIVRYYPEQERFALDLFNCTGGLH